MRIEARLERARHFPSLTEEFVGQYFYLKLAIDPSRRIIDNLETRRSG